jgi:hypothetical protein
MVYVADLHRDQLIKIGKTDERREKARQRELRVQLGEPLLEIVAAYTIPRGWGTDYEWEQSLLRTLRLRSERLQMFAMQHVSTEVVEATSAEAQAAMHALLRVTEVDPHLRADSLDIEREDWRFESFFQREYPECRGVSDSWRDPITRQTFLYWLRQEPIARWERLALGYSCGEVEELHALGPIG